MGALVLAQQAAGVGPGGTPGAGEGLPFEIVAMGVVGALAVLMLVYAIPRLKKKPPAPAAVPVTPAAAAPPPSPAPPAAAAPGSASAAAPTAPAPPAPVPAVWANTTPLVVNPLLAQTAPIGAPVGSPAAPPAAPPAAAGAAVPRAAAAGSSGRVGMGAASGRSGAIDRERERERDRAQLISGTGAYERPAESFAERDRRAPGATERTGPAYFGKPPTSLAGSAKIRTSGGPQMTPMAPERERERPVEKAPPPPPPPPPATEKERSEKIDMRSGGKFIPQGPTGEHDFDKWKEKRIVDELQEQNTELANMLTVLPGFTKRLSETTKKRELAPLLADMVARLCTPPPERIMVFFLSKSKDELVMASRVGYPEAFGGHSQTPIRIPKHRGRLGHAVKLQMVMDQKDFERDHVHDDPLPGQSWGTEVAAPLCYDKEVLGAISCEGFPGYSKNAKRLVGVLANLGALAISLAEKTAQIQHQANSDALTGLYNKRYFFERAEHEVERARQMGKPLSMFMFDIDHFKKYNDRNGHQAGDEALKITGHLLNERRRETDIAARYGGEEFIVILPDTNKEGAFAFAESFRKMVEAFPFPHGEGQPLSKVTISGGVSSFPEDGQGPSTLIEGADACLYRSKEGGRNQIAKKTVTRDVLA